MSPCQFSQSRRWLLLWTESMNLTAFAVIVYEVASFAVPTESRRVKGLAQLRLVLGMTINSPQFVPSVGELTPVAVLAEPALFKRTTQLRLVPAAVDLRVRLMAEKAAALRASIWR